MSRSKTARTVISSIVLLSLAAVGAPLGAAENPLEAVPANAGLVVRFQNPEASIKKAVDLATKVDAQFGENAQQISEGSGAMISNPELIGVDRKRDWWLAVFPVADGDPGIAYAIPATDAEAMQNAVGENFQFAKYDDWLLYTEDAKVAEQLQQRIGGQGESIGGVISTQSYAILDHSDLSVLVNVQQLKETYRAQLDAARRQVDELLEQMKGLSGDTPGVNTQAVFDTYRNLIHGLFQAVEDGKTYTAGLVIDEKGLAIDERLEVAADSPTDRFLQANQPSELAKLAKLPPDQLLYAAVHADMNALMQWGMKLSVSMLEGNAEQKQALNDAMAEYGKLELGDYLLAFKLAELEGGCVRSTQLIEVNNSRQMRDVTRKMTAAMANLQAGAVKQTIEYNADAEQYGKQSADVVVVKQEFDDENDPTAGFQRMLVEAMFGEEGITSRSVFLENLVVQTSGGGKETMQAALHAVQSNASPGESSKTPQIATREKLAAKANLIVLIDLPQLVSDVLELVSESGQLPIPVDANLLESLGLRRSYLGFSVTTGPAALSANVYVPVEQMQGMSRIVSMFMIMRQQPQF